MGANGHSYVLPQWTEVEKEHIRDVARHFARAHKTDPWAGPRITLHMLRGLILPSEVIQDANRLLTNQARFQLKPGDRA